MTRVLRYPRMSAAMCALVIACALLRDLCVSLALAGYARVLLHATFILLPVCMALLSCRFVVDAQGVSVGFLLHIIFIEECVQFCDIVRIGGNVR